ncbi:MULTISPECIES: glucuronate isomerase [unclassified Actinomyces]|uniref:glucuronate isomerase n=1 Tax=unclassified Actinomyces TaxID=2609248 RepID=UPI00201794CB|nr:MULTISPECIES: glucuronate isomerase [unclassified Actinomyces]MCL3778275.1 glucuronate isomerase [Actinomyces sp. AC-20-1]MCL3788737.1 glucuronate isomerase [Actinomyces sp. 187325]MCL3792852.1 glucuronate isomerase [Actinomyces sp. 186855]MCL3794367.1 glucuronate isomerase [Actinomyces sp. 217892]
MTDPRPLTLDPDRLLPADPTTRAIARELLATVEKAPIVSPHGHVPPEWLAQDITFADPTSLLLTPDHYTNRLLHSLAGVELEEMGVPVGTERTPEQSRRAFSRLCESWDKLAGTPVRSWFTHELHEVFGIRVRPSAETSDEIYDAIDAAIHTPGFSARSLYERFNIAVLATTDDPCSDLASHRVLAEDPTWTGRVVPTFRPDAYLEPARPGFRALTERLGEVSGADVSTYAGHVEAMRRRRAFFVSNGAVSSDHSHRDAGTERLPDAEAEVLYARALAGTIDSGDGDRLRRHMVNDQARLACEDGLVMTLHPAVYRNHDTRTFERYGADVGGDIPMATELTRALQPLLEAYGNHEGFHLIPITMDETLYSRELAPLAGWYRSVYVGVPWWFIDEPDAILRFRAASTGYATLYKTSGFIDDTRAFCSIPARHDIARRCDSAFLARLVAEGRVEMEDALRISADLVDAIPREAFKL